MAKRGGFAQVPVAKPKAIAGTNPVGTVALGTATPTMVPDKQAVIHGLDVPAHTIGHPSVKGAKRYGHVAKLGHMRLSGNPGAHRLGSKK